MTFDEMTDDEKKVTHVYRKNGRWYCETWDEKIFEIKRSQALEVVNLQNFKFFLSEENWEDIIKPDQPLLPVEN